jgi:hypothetical protein
MSSESSCFGATRFTASCADDLTKCSAQLPIAEVSRLRIGGRRVARCAVGIAQSARFLAVNGKSDTASYLLVLDSHESIVLAGLAFNQSRQRDLAYMRGLARGCRDYLGVERSELIRDMGIEGDARLVAVAGIDVTDSGSLLA